MLTVQEIETSKLRPWVESPRLNDHAVDSVAKSIRAFGFNAPILCDQNMTIIAGHTRWKAARKLGMHTVPTATPVLAARYCGHEMNASRHGKAASGPRLFPPAELRPSHEPVLISACLLGVPCRWHGRRGKRRDALIERLKRKYVLVPVCPEQLGGMPTPRSGEYLHGTGSQVLDEGLRIIASETRRDVTQYHINGAIYVLEIAKIVGAKRAYLKGGSPSCDRDGITGEFLQRGGLSVVRVP